jgi:hypothetical protein
MEWLQTQALFGYKGFAGEIAEFWLNCRAYRNYNAGEQSAMNRYLTTMILLGCSNVFMTFAWYGHLRNLSHRPWLLAALASWAIALFEYLLQVPANRVGYQVMNVGQLKLLQEVITLAVFVPFSLFYMKERLSLDYLWAGICLLGAVFFLFRAKLLA